MDVILKKPIEKDGQKIEKLNLDLGSITGIDILKAEQEAFMSGGGSFDPLFTLHGLAIVACNACGKRCYKGLDDSTKSFKFSHAFKPDRSGNNSHHYSCSSRVFTYKELG